MHPELTVYPRWRGEHNFSSGVVVIKDGLSPLARGTQVKEARRALAGRFIPAGAGNTNSESH
ncbi:hypothetical protein [Escherichia coli IS5]|nr:hypothetical protein [Escherichia coli IS5]